MNFEEMYTAINKGIPNYIMLEIDINTLLNECASNKEQLEKELSLIKELYRNNIINLMNYTKSQEFFFEKFRLLTSYKNAKTTIHISPIPFIKRLKELLNINNSSVDFNDKNLYQELLSRVEALKQTKTPEELQKEFPYIYQDYILSHTSLSKIRRYETKHNQNRTQEIQANIDKQYYLYKIFGLSTNFQTFIDNQSKLYRNLVVRRQYIEGHTNRTPIDFSMFEGLDKDKFELYLADKYLQVATTTEDDKLKQQCIYFISTYIRETKTNNITIKNELNQEISFKQIVRRYKKFLQKNPIIRPIDEPRENFKNYHIKHVENHVNKYFFTNVNWQIIPPGTEDELDRKVIHTLNRQYNYLSPEEREKKILERYSMYERKKRFFENSGYIHKLFGQNSFEGYIAYIYENGEVLMEKFFDDYAHCIPTIGEAIYNIKAIYFETLSKLSKPVLIKDKRCKRIIHTGNWEERSQRIIDKPSTSETKEEAKQLILRLQTKKTNE